MSASQWGQRKAPFLVRGDATDRRRSSEACDRRRSTARAYCGNQAGPAAQRLAPQRGRELHRHGCHERGCGARSAGPLDHSYGGRTAGTLAPRPHALPSPAPSRLKRWVTLATGTAPAAPAHFPPLRRALRRRRLAERIVVTTGSSARVRAVVSDAVRCGRASRCPRPAILATGTFCRRSGCTPVIVETGPETRWMPTLDQIAALNQQGGLDGLLIASPANPTGTMIEPERLRELAQYSAANSIWFISDEIYHGLSYAGTEATALAFSDDAIVINSFSKYFSMTGWRVGWMVVPQRLVRAAERLQQNLFISAPAASQAAAMGAFDGHERDRAQQGDLRREPGAAARGAGASRVRSHRAGRRRVLSLRRCLGFHRRRAYVRASDARRDRRRGDARHRLRRSARTPLHTLLLRRHDGRHAGKPRGGSRLGRG